MTELSNININLTSFQAYDVAQYLINTLEFLQKTEVKNGGLTYHENRIKKTFTEVIHTIFSQMDDDQENKIIEILDKEENEYNQTKNN